MNNCPNCGKLLGLHSSILQGCMCQYSMQASPQRTEQEPVAWGVDWGKDGNSVSIIKRLADGNIEVLAWEYAPYTPQRTWVGLTDEEVLGLFGKFTAMTGRGWVDLYRMAEAKLKEKNFD